MAEYAEGATPEDAILWEMANDPILTGAPDGRGTEIPADDAQDPIITGFSEELIDEDITNSLLNISLTGDDLDDDLLEANILVVSQEEHEQEAESSALALSKIFHSIADEMRAVQAREQVASGTPPSSVGGRSPGTPARPKMKSIISDPSGRIKEVLTDSARRILEIPSAEHPLVFQSAGGRRVLVTGEEEDSAPVTPVTWDRKCRSRLPAGATQEFL